ncbi:hypothetical protein CONCODRAFT_73188 [Conidiobolus coronatus NRRL 28638]|uniref:Leo1-domain-containing protein n=1 Tax=Conidiobolus coronatus (strain ATCC 28846 / CBS 209.66 / NRRL 28638) TaxID=796925 RepID=A0A137NWT9_CONC2|nr:hypothetical protein CONCODRAFT_73188 [Conidiobolus coronatus NRRL 28638]|eukprot:KXN67168.1 hypothetical protein CONCODRAFT_73188 [Conidiobolus coronatus NRRL 28638]
MPKRQIASSDDESERGNSSDHYVEASYSRRPLNSDDHSPSPSPKKRKNSSPEYYSGSEEEEVADERNGNTNSELAQKLFGSDAEEIEEEESVKGSQQGDLEDGLSEDNEVKKSSPIVARKIRTPSPPFKEDPNNQFDVILPWDFKNVTEQISSSLFLNMNNYLFVQEAPFNPDTFVPMTEDSKPNPDAELAIQAQLQVENTIRYRNASNSSSQPDLESNARLVEWDDGTFSIAIGDRLIDVNTVKKVKGGSFVAAHHPSENFYENLGRVAKDLVVPAPAPQDELFYKLRHFEDTKMQGISSTLEYQDPVEAKQLREQRIKSITTELANSGTRAFASKHKSNARNGRSGKRSNRRKDDFSDDESVSDLGDSVDEAIIAVASPPPDSGDKASRVEYIINAAKQSMDNPNQDEFDINEDF